MFAWHLNSEIQLAGEIHIYCDSREITNNFFLTCTIFPNRFMRICQKMSSIYYHSVTIGIGEFISAPRNRSSSLVIFCVFASLIFYKFTVIKLFSCPYKHRCYPLLFCPILILEKEPVFPLKCCVLKTGTTGTIFITSLVWCGTLLGIEH